MAKQDDTMVEMLQLQLSELDMLQSMFPNPGELQIDDPSSVADIHDYIDAKTTKLPTRLDFVLQLAIDEKIKFELSCSLPHDYPMTEPEVFVRSMHLNRAQQHQLNEDLLQYLNKLDRGELCIFSIIQWLKDNGANYVTVTAPERQESLSDNEEKNDFYCRYWIYSHHIYNKMKRRTILDLAKDYDLTGFCLPGKPGIICAEGTSLNCGEFWHRVKHMNWKKIMCKMKERVEPGNDKCIDSFRRFDSFEEIAFEVRHGPGREYHMDMGEFYKYLEKHESGYVFKNYFGVNGKLGTKD